MVALPSCRKTIGSSSALCTENARRSLRLSLRPRLDSGDLYATLLSEDGAGSRQRIIERQQKCDQTTVTTVMLPHLHRT